MKTKSTTTFTLLFSAFTFFAHATGFGQSENKGYKVEFSQARGTDMNLNFSLEKINISEVTFNGITYSNLDFGGSVLSNEKGYAALPIISASVQLPPDKNVSLVTENGSYTEYNLNYPLLPSRGTIYRNQDPSKIPYVINPSSIVDAWYPTNIATSIEPFIIRDIRGTSVYVHPIQYNAAKQILRVYNSIRVNLVENNSTPINPLTDIKKYVDPEMFTTYKSVFLNYNKRTNWANEAGEYGEILVIYTSRDATVIKPYINWKKQMGFKVTEQQVTTGTNVKTTISTAYGSNKNITYVLLVGDWADIKSDLGGGANAPMDPMLGCVVGTDNFSDIIIGRFSAGSTTDVTAQVNKTITYEKSPNGTWYKTALHLASAEGPGDDNEMDKAQQENIWNGRLSKFTYTTKKTAYDPGATANTVSSAVNAGVGVINYVGHGSTTSWGTTGFSNTNVNSLTNEGLYPFIFSVACINGEFHKGTCFAEAWLRKVNGGAVAVVMSTILQPWNPPMRGQDYMNDLLTGGYTYANNATNPGKGTNTDHGKTHFGSITLNGCVLMYAESNASEDLETIQTWSIFGDPSLQVRTDAPKAIVISNPNVAMGSYTTKITVGGNPFANALVSVWDGTNQPFSALTDASGNVTIPHTLANGSAATLTVTGFNLTPYIATVTIGVTSVNNIGINNSLQLYPNPNNGEFELNYSLINNENSNVKIVDLLGNIVYSDLLMQNAQSKTISLTNAKNGLYFLSFENSNGTVTQKITIQK